tara:strand:- start:3233 stop:4915 length:1683 start_codon:yes stop_codon:yes gene_type:complete
MAQPQQNITIDAPGFQGINTEDSPLQQDTNYCLVADNAVVDRFGRIGCRKAFAEYTTAVNVSYTPAVGVASTAIKTHRLGSGILTNTTTILATVSVIQRDAAGSFLQEDYFLCKLVGLALEELTLPTMLLSSSLADAQIVSFKDEMFVFSIGNDPLVYDGTTVTNLSADPGYITPQDQNGTIAVRLDGNIAISAYGRLWVTGVDSNYTSIYYSDLLIPAQWYDGRTVPADPLNTGGILDVAAYWPKGTDRIVNLVAHNNALFIFGRNSILVYEGAASADPAGVDGIRLADTVSNIGLVSRDAVANIGTDILFVDDSGVRSLGRTIQEKSVPIGDLTYNIRRDITLEISSTADKKTISLSYWPDEDISVLLFSGSAQAFVIEMRAPSNTGGSKMTRWTGCVFERALYYEEDDAARAILASSIGDGVYEYTEFLEHTGEAYQFKYQSSSLTMGQPANLKFLKQIDYTIVSSKQPTIAHAEWGYKGRLDYSREITVDAQVAALYDIALFGVGEFGLGLTTIKRYRVNTKGSGESLLIGLRADIAGNGFSLQQINIQTLLGRIN